MSEANSTAPLSLVEGGLLIDKPAGLTSHDVVARVRRALMIRRVGHTGTLDPMATGLLVVLLGRATRLSQFLTGCDKEYLADVQLGVATDTYDSHGKPTSPLSRSSETLPIAEIESALEQFRGVIDQVPPMYSAKKREGVPLYRLARKGVEVERPAARVTVHELEPQQVETRPAGQLLKLRVRCSSGTYIRSLAHELGMKLGCGGHLVSLRRTAVGNFHVSAASTLDAFESHSSALGERTYFVPSHKLLSDLPSIAVDEEQRRNVLHGRAIRTGEVLPREGEPCQLLDSSGALIAIAYRGEAQGELMPRIVLTDTEGGTGRK